MEVGSPSPLYPTYLRNKPTNTNNATSPAKPDSPNVFMIDVRFPITLTPKIPLQKRTSDTAPMATKDSITSAISSIHDFTVFIASFMFILR